MKDVALQYLDEIGNADGCQLTAMRGFMVHFELTPEGKLQFHSFAELVERAIVEKAYPMLDEFFHGDTLSDPTEPTARDLALIRATVAKELGRSIAEQMDAPAPLMDSIARRLAGEKLKNFHRRGKPH